MTYINEQRSINRWPCVHKVFCVVQLGLSQTMDLSGAQHLHEGPGLLLDLSCILIYFYNGPLKKTTRGS